MERKQSRTIFSFFGPPGSGKGTLAQKLVERGGFQVLSTGNLCRKHMSNATELGKKIRQYVDLGHLIPDDLISDMVIDWLQTQQNSEAPVVLDGFPRTQGQATHFLDFLKKQAPRYTFRVIVIEIPEEEIVSRLSRRLVCGNKNCQTPASSKSSLSNCQLCGALLIKRDDDREEVIRERLALYPAYRDALLNYYHRVGQLVEQLVITGLSPEVVYDRFMALVGGLKQDRGHDYKE
jgi:adenylate kinase